MRTARQWRGRMKPLRPGFKSGLELLLDQKAAETGAVDEEIPFDARAVREQHGGDVAVCGSRSTATILPSCRTTPRSRRSAEGNWHRGWRRNDTRRAGAARRFRPAARHGRSGSPQSPWCGKCSGQAVSRSRGRGREASNCEMARPQARCRRDRRHGHKPRRAYPSHRNAMPSLYVPPVAARNSASSIPSD